MEQRFFGVQISVNPLKLSKDLVQRLSKFFSSSTLTLRDKIDKIISLILKTVRKCRKLITFCFKNVENALGVSTLLSILQQTWLVYMSQMSVTKPVLSFTEITESAFQAGKLSQIHSLVIPKSCFSALNEITVPESVRPPSWLGMLNGPLYNYLNLHFVDDYSCTRHPPGHRLIDST